MRRVCRVRAAQGMALARLAAAASRSVKAAAGASVARGAVVGPLAAAGGARGLNFWEIFDREKLRANRERITEDMRRGYFADLRELEKNQGKLSAAQERLAPPHAADAFPHIVAACGTALPPAGPDLRAALVCVMFKQAAQDMVDSWTVPFANAYAMHEGRAKCVVLSLVDSVLWRVPLMQRILVNSAKASQHSRGEEGANAPELLYAFADHYSVRKQLRMPNTLTAYAFLVDGDGRVRWRASGRAAADEVQALLRCSDKLLFG